MSRRLARETALRVLFQVELGKMQPSEALEISSEDMQLEAEDRAFCTELVQGALQHKEQIDRLIAANAVDWRLERLANTDRNVLRIALFEILHRDDIPHNVSINEAVDLAKIYGSEQSGKFVNGILGNVVRNQVQSENPL